MAKGVFIDGRTLSTSGKNTERVGFYGLGKQIPGGTSGFLGLQDPQNLASLIVKALLASPEYLASLDVYANEAAALAAGLDAGTPYQTSTGELRIKL